MTGGQHASIGEAMAAVKSALLDRIQDALAAAGETEVDARMGFMWPAQWYDQVALTETQTRSVDETVTLQRRQHKQIMQDVVITSFRVTADQEETMLRAAQLLDIIDRAVRNEPTLGGAAMWCFADDLASDGETDPKDASRGRVDTIVVTFAARVLITRP